MKKQQTGGTIVGFIVGVIVGLGAALAVAVYVTKVPVPFLNKGNGRGVDMDAAETQKNKNWDPNSPLYGKNPARPAAPPAVAASAPTPAAPDARAVASAPAPKPAASKPEAKAAAKGNLDPFDYFVQAGAFRTQADADAQRAKLAMLGWEARVSEREQNGRAVFRVRVGPFTKRDDAEQLKEKLDGAGLESALVRVQR
jgi:cell division protein FtsN